MRREEITELHYIAPIANLASIAEHGILSHSSGERHEHISLADPEVQLRRAQRSIPKGLKLHEYANLYFNARNAMLFRILRRPDKPTSPGDLVVLRVAPAVLDRPGVVVTDMNAAASADPRWYPVQEGLRVLVANELHAEFWTSSRRLKQRMMAEALVPHRVKARYITGAYVVDSVTANRVTVVMPTLTPTINTYMYFAGRRP